MDNFRELQATELQSLPGGYPDKYYTDLEGVLVSEEEIARAVDHIASAINEHYAGISFGELLIVPILQGALPFYSDLMRQLRLPLQHDSFKVSSYDGKHSTGEYKITKDVSIPIFNKHVLLIEDIVDTGGSAAFMKEYLGNRNPKSLMLASMFSKPERRTTSVDPDFNGFVIPDHFVVGYGLDWDGRYRELPFVAAVKD